MARHSSELSWGHDPSVTLASPHIVIPSEAADFSLPVYLTHATANRYDLLLVNETMLNTKKNIREPRRRNPSSDTQTDGSRSNGQTVSLVDLSHTIVDGMITYKGIPAPVICDFLSREASKKFYAEGTSFQIGKIDMAANTGTYLDSPFHRFAEGKDISELDLRSLAGLDAVVVRVVGAKTRAIDHHVFKAVYVREKAVLVHTDWAKHWRTDQYFEGHPFFTKGAALYLREEGVRLVGVDSLNIDDIDDGTRPVHTTLLGAEIPIVEHLCNLDKLPISGFTFTAVPAPVKGMGTFPVRAFATLPS
jgi:arylformamidase